jgi:hypothetical protein
VRHADGFSSTSRTPDSVRGELRTRDAPQEPNGDRTISASTTEADRSG